MSDSPSVPPSLPNAHENHPLWGEMTRTTIIGGVLELLPNMTVQFFRFSDGQRSIPVYGRG